MILNMTGGGSGPVIVDFTITEDFPFTREDYFPQAYTINGVDIPGGRVHGFDLYPINSEESAEIYQLDVCVNRIVSDGHKQGRLRGDLWAVACREYMGALLFDYYHDTNTNAFIYDPAQKTLKVRVALSGSISSYLKAANYRLIAW